MPLLEIFILALALSADAFTIGASVGLRHPGARQVFRLSFHFGLFQSLMSLAGALAGSLFVRYMEPYDHWVVCALLCFIGVRMIYLAVKGEPERLAQTDLTRGLSLIGLSLAVSMDALGAGIGLSAARASITLAVVIIGLVSLFATLIAMLLADRLRNILGHRAEIGAGIVLIGLGVWTVVDHMGKG